MAIKIPDNSVFHELLWIAIVKKIDTIIKIFHFKP
jgi:hypothetical protein